MIEIVHKIEFGRTQNNHKLIFCKKYTEDENNVIIQADDIRDPRDPSLKIDGNEIKINKGGIINITETY